MLHDELRFVTFNIFNDLEYHGMDIGEFNELVNMIGDCLNETDPLKSQLLLKPSDKYIQPAEALAVLKQFLCSTMFFYIPVPEEEYKMYKTTVKRPIPDGQNYIIYNMAQARANRHARLYHPDLSNDYALRSDDSMLRLKDDNIGASLEEHKDNSDFNLNFEN